MSERTQYRCITPSFNPSTRHNKKLMDGEGWSLPFFRLTHVFMQAIGLRDLGHAMSRFSEIAAYRAALGKLTRDRVPLAWTQA